MSRTERAVKGETEHRRQIADDLRDNFVNRRRYSSLQNDQNITLLAGWFSHSHIEPVARMRIS